MLGQLDWLEPRVGEAVSEYLAARWREREHGVRRGPPLPAVLSDSRTRSRLEEWRRAARRGRTSRCAEMLWRWFATAQVENDPAVVRALRARDSAALVAARNAAVGGDYRAHVRDRDELPETIQIEPAGAPFGLEPLAAGAGVQDVIDRLGEAGLEVRGVELDVSLAAPEDAPVAACTFPVDPPHDVRVYVRAPHTARGLRLLAHELGHAAYASGHDPELPWSLRTAPSRAVHEGVAALAEWVVVGHRSSDVTRQRELADAESGAYAGAGELTGAMMDDPGAQSSYLYAHEVARRLAPVGSDLAQRVFRIGASVTVAELLDAL